MSTDLRLPPIRTCLEHYASDIPTPGRPGASDHSMNRQEHHGQLPDRRPYDHQGFERSRQPRLPPINIGRPSAESSRPASSISSVHERSIGPPLRSPVTLTTPSQEGFTSLNSSALPSPATSGFPISYPSSTHSTHSTISHHNTGPGPWSSDPSPQYTWKAPTASGSSPNARKRRGNLPKESTSILNAWFYQHIAYPYPKEEEKLQLQALTGLSISQVRFPMLVRCAMGCLIMANHSCRFRIGSSMPGGEGGQRWLMPAKHIHPEAPQSSFWMAPSFRCVDTIAEQSVKVATVPGYLIYSPSKRWSWY